MEKWSYLNNNYYFMIILIIVLDTIAWHNFFLLEFELKCFK